MRPHRLRLTLAAILVAMIPAAAYCTLYSELRSIKNYESPNLDIKLNPIGLGVALFYVATSGSSLLRVAAQAESSSWFS